MRKFLFNASILGVLFGGVSAARQTIRGPRTWRTWLMWAGWAISAVIAVTEVIDADREARAEADADEDLRFLGRK